MRTNRRVLLGMTIAAAALLSACSDSSNGCTLQSDCGDVTKFMCFDNQCTLLPAVHCVDGKLNESETDVDCGGACSIKCAVSKACNIDGDCDSGLCKGEKCAIKPCALDSDCPSNQCDKDKGICVSCLDGIKNGKETDVDCGAGCGPCAKGKACNEALDCLSENCESNVCTGDPVACEAATIDDLVINEVMGAPDTAKPFATSPSPQVEFIEIVNVSNKRLDISGITLQFNKVADPKITIIPLKGCLAAKSAAVVAEGPIADMPADVLFISGKTAITNSGIYSFNLTDGDIVGESITSAPSTGNGTSQTRIPDITGEVLEFHDEAKTKLLNSPGFCNNGGIFSKGCAVVDRCIDGKKNDNETDVDCGGSKCAACNDGQVCLLPTDCLSDSCVGDVCIASEFSRPEVGDLIIAEVFNYVTSTATMLVYDKTVTDQKQVEYFEIVNLSPKVLNLNGVKIVGTRTDAAGTLAVKELSGTLAPFQAIVVSDLAMRGLPEGVISLPLAFGTNFITNTGLFTFSLNDSKGNVLHTASTSEKDVANISKALASRSAGDAALIAHNVINKGLNHSPGYCSNGGLYVEQCRVIVLCDNGVKDVGETDVDCGGPNCSACALTKACVIAEDCQSAYCNNKVCELSPFVAPMVGDLVISEVLNNSNTAGKLTCYDKDITDQVQMEYFEIVNLTNKEISLAGLKITLERLDSSTKYSPLTLSGSLAANQAVVVSDQKIDCLPEGVKSLALGFGSSFLTNSAILKISLIDSEDKVIHTASTSENDDKNKGVSKVIEFLTPLSKDLILHTSTPKKLSNSPGYCSNGGLFVNNCVPIDFCANNVKDNGETDIDCGGLNCGGCAETKACIENSDCLSVQCDTNVCVGEPLICVAATVDDLVINEVMGSPSTSEPFATSTTKQVEFIEIVNKTTTNLDLSAVTLSFNKVLELSTVTLPLKGCLMAKSAAVVTSVEIAGLPSDVLYINATTSITNGSAYEFYLNASGTKGPLVIREGISGNGVSQTRVPDITGTELKPHSTAGALKNSPGFCNNGKEFTKDCI